MAGADKTKETVQGAAPAEATGQATIDLAKQPEQPSTILEVQTPEWVAELLESNKAVQDSNQAVIEALASLKDFAVNNVGNQDSAPKHQAEKQLNPDAEYEVAEGKSFRDPKNFTLEYKEGEDVSHLGEEVLTRLLNQGLITEA